MSTSPARSFRLQRRPRVALKLAGIIFLVLGARVSCQISGSVLAARAAHAELEGKRIVAALERHRTPLMGYPRSLDEIRGSLPGTDLAAWDYYPADGGFVLRKTVRTPLQRGTTSYHSITGTWYYDGGS
jgi:hypothetical protein